MGESKETTQFCTSSQQEQDQILLQPFTYIQKLPGKGFRTKLSRAFNHWLKIPQEKLHVIDEIVEMLHHSSLLIDDIQDNSILRRGLPVAHSIYGLPSTINAAIYAGFIALEKGQQLNHPEANRVFIEQMLELHRGQGIEIYWRDHYVFPTKSDYSQMAVRKTGGLFGLIVKLMQLYSSNKDDFLKLTTLLGLYYQIRDDYCNIKMEEYIEGKGFFDDLTDGKFSFPIVHAIKQGKDVKELVNILKQRTSDVGVKKYFIGLLERSGSLKYTTDILEALEKLVRKEVERLGYNLYMEVILDMMVSWKGSSSISNPETT